MGSLLQVGSAASISRVVDEPVVSLRTQNIGLLQSPVSSSYSLMKKSITKLNQYRCKS